MIPILFYVTSKVGYQVRDKLYVGAGLIAASTFIPEANIRGGIPYGLITYGTEEKNVTLGSGFGLLWDDEGDFQSTPYPISTLNFMIPLSERIQVVSENWIIPTKDDQSEKVRDIYMVLSVGMRVRISRNSTVDFAPIFMSGVDNAPVIPYLDFVYKF